MDTPTVIGKYERPLTGEQEEILLECVRSGMDPYHVCWMMKFHPSRWVRHMAKQGDFRKAFKEAELEGAKVDKFELYLLLIENGRKHRPAQRLAGLNGMQIYNRRQADDAFDLAIREAEIHAHEALETEAYRRAYDGSDVLAMFMLKAGDPQKYRETQRRVDEEKEVPTDDLDKFERGKRIVFALQLAAHGQAAGSGPRNEQDPREPPVDPAARPAD